MSFRDNLQHLRATHAMTQEQLALMLGVSRQSVTKWEAEKSYPEMDKLLKLCQIFDVTLDDLVQGDLTTSVPTAAVQARAAVLREAAGGPPQDVCGYDEHMRAFAWKIAWGVFAILIGVALLMAVAGWAEATAPSLAGASLIPLFAGIAVGLGLIVTAAFQHTEFQRSHPFIQDFYTVEDRQRTQRLFAWHCARFYGHRAYGFDRLLERICSDRGGRAHDGAHCGRRVVHRIRFHDARPAEHRQLQRCARAGDC